MTEAKWLACNFPSRMLDYLQVLGGVRLAACACLQLVWDGGVRPPCSYAALRAALDALLANRLPDVELLTAGVVACCW